MSTAKAGNLSVPKNTMKKFNSLIRGGILSAALTLATFAAGPLTPPGAPGDAPTQMPSLVEIKAAIDALAAASLNGRTAIPAQAATYTISAPGNYVLTGNITVATGDGISITASDVTLDLNGFTIKSTAATAAGAGIRTSNTSSNIRIHNGRISSGFTSPAGIATPGPGFTFGIQLDVVPGSPADSWVFEDLFITGINGNAISQTNTAAATNWSNVVARRVTVDGQSGILLVHHISSHFGKIIDCNVRTNSGLVSVAAGLVGQTIATNQSGGGTISTAPGGAFNNNP